MNYKEKFEDFLNRMTGLLDEANKKGHIIVRVEDLENAFPELKESEDEKIRKELLDYCKNRAEKYPNDPKYKNIGAWISWLEKQGEQKHADKVKPKFHEGDFIKYNKGNFIYKVTSVNGDSYRVENIETGNRSELLNAEPNFHLWTIQDAKDGDVVVDKSDGAIGIFQSIGHHPNGGSCNDPSYCFLHCRYDDGFFYADFEHGNMIDSDDLIPATKEKRDLLFKKMHEAGYEWDSEKKELKKTENEIEIPFGAKDSELQEATYYYYIPKGFHAEIDNDKVVIKKGEKPAEWSEDDALRLEEVICMIEANGRWVRSDDALKLVLDWLKSIRPRIMGLK